MGAVISSENWVKSKQSRARTGTGVAANFGTALLAGFAPLDTP